jgi:hypothetical protein
VPSLKKKIVSFSGSLPTTTLFLCPVLIRDLTVCAAWFDKRDRVVRWVAGERTTA